MTYLKTKPYALRCDEGQKLQSMGALISVKATSEQTGGCSTCSMLLARLVTPRRCTSTTPKMWRSMFWRAALTFFWGSEMKEAVAGSYFFQPRGTPHGFRVEGATPARILYMTIPAGFDCFVFEQELLAPRSEPEMVAARYKIEILGPLPE